MAGWLGLRTQPHFAAVRAHTIGFVCAISHHASSRYQIERKHGRLRVILAKMTGTFMLERRCLERNVASLALVTVHGVAL
jgi:hypothetical protein